ncbi:MAG: DUF1800 family protein, partial [Flavobacteriaceae bacterium]|nr:DUF1800 family protein [Flavobacteriaceae bacterium]
KEGYFGGEDIIDIILEQKQCARFICTKMYQYFVNDTIDSERVEELTNVFYQHYKISEVMRHIMLSDWFYSEENIGVKIKSPIEFLIGIHRTVPMHFEVKKELLYLQRLLGQLLLFPPNVAGWAGGRSWIDANTMMLRLKLPSVLLNNGEISLDEKGAFEDNFERFDRKNNRARKLHVNPDWTKIEEELNRLSDQEIQNNIITAPINIGTKKYLDSLDKTDKRVYCIQLMSLPEYQLC